MSSIPPVCVAQTVARAASDNLQAKRSGRGAAYLADQGVDVGLKGVSVEGYEAAVALTDFAERHGLARLSIDDGIGPETRFEPQPVTITLSGKAVPLPSGAFLQATADGEAALVVAVREAVGGAHTADLFAGLGTFALALGGKVTAAEAARDAVLSLKSAAPGIEIQHPTSISDRSIAPRRLRSTRVLNPPLSRAHQFARSASSFPRVAYVIENPRPSRANPECLLQRRRSLGQNVGQFRWSTHVELASAFSR